MNTVYSQFQQALKREKQFITTYYDNIQYPCLYRKVDDYKNTSNHIEIFYDVATPIKQGQLLTHGGKAFIVINKESVENDTYYKSVIKKCNLTIPVTIGGVVKQIPCYSYELSSAYNISNNMINFVDGKGEIITELIPELSNSIYINTGLRIMGGYFDVVNTYDIDNIVHIMLEKKVLPLNEYALEITTELSDYKVGETATIIPNPTKNGIPQTDQTITYISSDKTLATVDADGVITFLGVGTVVITGIWVEHSEITDTLSLRISEEDAPVENTLTITANRDKLTIGGSIPVTFTPTLKDSDDNVIEITETPVWTFDYNGMPTSDFTVTYDGNNCKIKVAENYDLIEKILRVICTTADGLYSGYIDITLTI